MIQALSASLLRGGECGGRFWGVAAGAADGSPAHRKAQAGGTIAGWYSWIPRGCASRCPKPHLTLGYPPQRGG